MSTIYKSPISGSQILDHVLTITQRNARVTPGHLGFGIVRIQIDIGKNPTIRIPAANICVRIVQRKLLARRAAAFYYQRRMDAVDRPDRRERSLLLWYQGRTDFPN